MKQLLPGQTATLLLGQHLIKIDWRMPAKRPF
jgi:hypothetical protein